MKKDAPVTDRRWFLKSSALVAAPLATAAAPAVALADDGSSARLARLEDEREIEWLHRRLLRHVCGAGDCSNFVAGSDAIQIKDQLRSIVEDPARVGSLALADDGTWATTHRPVKVEIETAFTGDTTLEQMARFQGQGSQRRLEERVLATEFVKGAEGWRIARARLA